MAEPAALDLLSTKIYRPPLPADCVHRSDLLRLLDEGRSRPLTLVSAPAGYGKSVLVSNWLENSDWASVWVSLDEDDSDPQRFLSYLAAALREHFPDALEVTRSLGRTTQLPDASSVANVVSNELNALGRPFFPCAGRLSPHSHPVPRQRNPAAFARPAPHSIAPGSADPA